MPAQRFKEWTKQVPYLFEPTVDGVQVLREWRRRLQARASRPRQRDVSFLHVAKLWGGVPTQMVKEEPMQRLRHWLWP